MIEVRYIDEWLAVVNKPAGLMVHDSALARDEHDFLADRLREQFGRPLFLMASRDDYERAIKPAESAPLCRVRSQPTFDVKLRNVLSRQRLPEILLLTNKCGP